MKTAGTFILMAMAIFFSRLNGDGKCQYRKGTAELLNITVSVR